MHSICGQFLIHSFILRPPRHPQLAWFPSEVPTSPEQCQGWGGSKWGFFKSTGHQRNRLLTAHQRVCVCTVCVRFRSLWIWYNKPVKLFPGEFHLDQKSLTQIQHLLQNTKTTVSRLSSWTSLRIHTPSSPWKAHLKAKQRTMCAVLCPKMQCAWSHEKHHFFSICMILAWSPYIVLSRLICTNALHIWLLNHWHTFCCAKQQETLDHPLITCLDRKFDQSCHNIRAMRTWLPKQSKVIRRKWNKRKDQRERIKKRGINEISYELTILLQSHMLAIQHFKLCAYRYV